MGAVPMAWPASVPLLGEPSGRPWLSNTLLTAMVMSPPFLISPTVHVSVYLLPALATELGFVARVPLPVPLTV